MAEDDTRDSQTATSSSGTFPPKKLPKGIVLGKDGKPCRTCNSYSSFASASKSSVKSSIPKDCPPDVEELGRSTWTLLHSITATYPPKPSPPEQTQMRTFLSIFSKIYPCWVCAEDFQSYMEKERVRVESREAFGRWMCEAHNDVNRKLGKKEFDCGKWEERWGGKGDGDGRCG